MLGNAQIPLKLRGPVMDLNQGQPHIRQVNWPMFYFLNLTDLLSKLAAIEMRLGAFQKQGSHSEWAGMEALRRLTSACRLRVQMDGTAQNSQHSIVACSHPGLTNSQNIPGKQQLKEVPRRPRGLATLLDGTHAQLSASCLLIQS